MHKKTVLNNGLRVITHSMPGRQSAAMGIWIKTGGRYESSGIKGVSHFIEHLLFKGSKKYSCRQIKESIEGIGGALNGFTSEELTCYLVKIPARYLDIALDILCDMVLSPLFLSKDIYKERTVILEEIKMYKDLPQSYVHELLDELIWPGHPLGMSIAGSFDSVNRIERKDILDYKQHYYVPGNMLVSASGLLKHDDFVRRIAKRFSASKPGKVDGFQPFKQDHSRQAANVFYKETEQTHMAIGFSALRRDHPLKHALTLMNIILGANMSSRLFNEVREKRGLAYEIGTQVRRFQDTGAFVVHAGVDNKKAQDAVQVILKELTRIKRHLVAGDELKRAKEFYLGQIMLSLEDTMDNMLWLGESESLLDKTYKLEDIIKEVKKVSREDIQEVAGRVFEQAKINFALIGPVKDKKSMIEKLKMG